METRDTWSSSGLGGPPDIGGRDLRMGGTDPAASSGESPLSWPAGSGRPKPEIPIIGHGLRVPHHLAKAVHTQGPAYSFRTVTALRVSSTLDKIKKGQTGIETL